MIELSDAIPILQDLKNENKLMLFVGSGISVPPPSNLPTWEGFLDAFIEFCKNIETRYQHHFTTPLFTDELVSDATNEKAKYPGVVASVLKNKLTELPERIKSNVMNEYKAWFTHFFGFKEPNDYHTAIIEAGYQYILTSNYDTLLEEAAIRAGKIYNSVSFFERTNLAETIYTETPAIIHVHGKYPDIVVEKTIFTSDDYFKIIKKQYPAFTSCSRTAPI